MLGLIMCTVIAIIFDGQSTLFLGTLDVVTHVILTTNLESRCFIRKLRHKEDRQFVQS